MGRRIEMNTLNNAIEERLHNNNWDAQIAKHIHQERRKKSLIQISGLAIAVLAIGLSLPLTKGSLTSTSVDTQLVSIDIYVDSVYESVVEAVDPDLEYSGYEWIASADY